MQLYHLEHRRSEPSVRHYRTPLVLVHGAWHGAWCWDAAMYDFAQRGITTHAISLRGHGGSDTPRHFNLTGLHDYVHDLARALAAIEPRPVVVGHSMGGYVLQLLLMQQPLPAGVLLASLPVSGATRFILDWARQHPFASLRGLLTGNLRHFVGTPALARQAFFRPDIDATELQRYTAQLGPESLRIAVETMGLVRPLPRRIRTPLLVIAAERDAIFTLDEQRRTAAAYAADLLVVPEATHDLMLDTAWPIAADAIEGILAGIRDEG